MAPSASALWCPADGRRLTYAIRASKVAPVRSSVARDQRALVVIPVYGHDDLTHAVLGDLRRERHRADVVVVDNRGDYPAVGDEVVLRPGQNLGWAAGTNLGTREHLGTDHAGVVWLNNDTRLSRDFVAGLLETAARTGAGIVGPQYDCFWLHQRPIRATSVERFRARNRHVPAPFVDGTCMFVSKATIDSIGVLDDETFGPIGWGADFDYCFRCREDGRGVVISGLSYLHHEKSVTATTLFAGLDGYASEGYPAFVEGLEAKWGPDWPTRAGLDPRTGQTVPRTRRLSLGR